MKRWLSVLAVCAACGGSDADVAGNGDVDGNDFVLELFGTPSQNSGNCTFTYNSVIDGAISGDTLTGRIEYRAATNGNPDCAAITGCVSFQEFNGTRPPAP